MAPAGTGQSAAGARLTSAPLKRETLAVDVNPEWLSAYENIAEAERLARLGGC